MEQTNNYSGLKCNNICVPRMYNCKLKLIDQIDDYLFYVNIDSVCEI